MATANAATFDGTGDYLTRDADYTGNANSKLWAFAIWFAVDTTPIFSDIQVFMFGTGASYEATIFTDGSIRIQGQNSAGTEILDMDTAASTINDTNWHCLMVSVDMADTGKRHIYLDDTDVFDAASTYTDAAIDFTCSHFGSADHGIGARTSGIRKFSGTLGPYWCDFGQYIDFSDVTNRRVFYTSDGKVPASLANSTNGNVGGFGQPIVFLNNEFSTYQTNLGSGGGLTENGTLTTATGPEVGGVRILRRRREMVGAF